MTHLLFGHARVGTLNEDPGVPSNASTEGSEGSLAADAGSPGVAVCFTTDDGKRMMTTASACIPLPIDPSGGRPLPYACAAPTFPSISFGSSSSKIATENQWSGSSGGGSRPQPPSHRSQASRSNSSTSASSAIHGGPGREAYKTADETASAVASEVEARGDNAGNAQCCDPWDTDPSAVDLLLLRAAEQRNKSPTPAHATPAAKGAPSTNEMARQPVYETTLGPRVKQREPNQGPDRPAQSPAITLLGPQQQPRAGPLHPVRPRPRATREAPQDSPHRRTPAARSHHRTRGAAAAHRYSPVPSSNQSQHPMVPAAVAVAIPQSRLPPPEITTQCSDKRQLPLTRAIHHHGRPPPGTPPPHPPGPSPSSALPTKASRRSPQGQRGAHGTAATATKRRPRMAPTMPSSHPEHHHPRTASQATPVTVPEGLRRGEDRQLGPQKSTEQPPRESPQPRPKPTTLSGRTIDRKPATRAQVSAEPPRSWLRAGRS
ncbi:nascent polypeptide-associated complex subunit alpha, muscle-specific form-like [Dermacentor silvarum]|uniref:nascent polypeptide-associated complex subunit alpha, muscle-specific form-like n=1 Tax=Dermacentor silvarum TaxID=543639 RepID=UPI0021017D6B|nr:nascent polypeptide-associated complex subunit alpha, muscle-specific form-like [Dermacentor silvarum]